MSREPEWGKSAVPVVFMETARAEVKVEILAFHHHVTAESCFLPTLADRQASC